MVFLPYPTPIDQTSTSAQLGAFDNRLMLWIKNKDNGIPLFLFSPCGTVLKEIKGAGEGSAVDVTNADIDR